MQMQFVITGIQKMFILWFGHFPHGYVIDKIIFDAEYWNNLKFVSIFLQ